ncbi:hypothetical protein P262_01137 [Cronobacter malonaticus]|uniref:Uncharacterized protein n=1 Tax=Cronobacter malonaticus TaxID=413503 RepID=V5TVL4_9ENTR|nr:hypothetical protein P262_01137 [Cronobacter malonaticus]CCJ93962.1 hypothetical protein BN131_1635 [Cronobacter malonaticus 681]CCJ98554.1 hypothetical protein BN130_1132 [Cronobacter malonaticus 507]
MRVIFLNLYRFMVSVRRKCYGNGLLFSQGMPPCPFIC